MKKVFTLFCLFVFINSAYAVQNYTYTKIEDEYYSASSPAGHFEEYNTYNNPIYVENNLHNVGYMVQEPVAASIQDVYTPQSYNRKKVITESMRDDREKADKIIDRVSTIGFTAGFLGLVTMGILGIVHAF